MWSPKMFVPLFMSMTIISTISVMSVSNWIILWVMFEINMISFIPLFNLSKLQSDSPVKYFIPQAIGSLLLILGSIHSFSTYMTLLTLCGVFLKLAAVPFHQWFPSIMLSSSWPMCLMLAFWQKLAPLAVIFLLMSTKFLFSIPMMTVSLLSAMVGAIYGMTQTQTRSLMAYSSISHSGWILLAMLLSSMISFMYITSYAVMTTILFLILYLSNSSSVKDLSKQPKFYMPIFISSMSLAGMPPLLGFFPKLLVMKQSLNLELFPPVIVMILSSLISIFFYLKLVTPNFAQKEIYLNTNNYSSLAYLLSSPLFLLLLL